MKSSRNGIGLARHFVVAWQFMVVFFMSYSSLYSQQSMSKVEMVPHVADSIVEIRINGDLFTNYRYSQQLEKPVLYPLISPHGKTVTRGFPLDPRPGERFDHPHHVGLWLNYGDVNGLDFWNNSSAIPKDKLDQYGKIFHDEYQIVSSDGEDPSLQVHCTWRNHAGDALLSERTTFHFRRMEGANVIDRITTLTALKDVSFEDNKEGFIGMRMARELELPSDKPDFFTDAQGNVTEVKVLDNSRVTGNYLSSEGLTGDAVWGTRGRWVRLAGSIEGTPISVVIIDHPDNVGYPTYWHARGYGLFAANPLGQSVFSEGKEALHFKLPDGQSTTFKYRIVIHDGNELTPEAIEKMTMDFVN